VEGKLMEDKDPLGTLSIIVGGVRTVFPHSPLSIHDDVLDGMKGMEDKMFTFKRRGGARFTTRASVIESLAWEPDPDGN
jgi:hypothetical protein